MNSQEERRLLLTMAALAILLLVNIVLTLNGASPFRLLSL